MQRIFGSLMKVKSAFRQKTILYFREKGLRKAILLSRFQFTMAQNSAPRIPIPALSNMVTTSQM